jgi:hypothetical protein
MKKNKIKSKKPTSKKKEPDCRKFSDYGKSFEEWVSQVTDAKLALSEQTKVFALAKAEMDRVQKKTAPILEMEASVKRSISLRSPEIWAEEIEKLPESVRVAVACVVWWDFFGQRLSSERWGHLDKWTKAKYVPATQEELTRGLFAVGYSPWVATNRAQEDQVEVDDVEKEEEKELGENLEA